MTINFPAIPKEALELFRGPSAFSVHIDDVHAPVTVGSTFTYLDDGGAERTVHVDEVDEDGSVTAWSHGRLEHDVDDDGEVSSRFVADA